MATKLWEACEKNLPRLALQHHRAFTMLIEIISIFSHDAICIAFLILTTSDSKE